MQYIEVTCAYTNQTNLVNTQHIENIYPVNTLSNGEPEGSKSIMYFGRVDEHFFIKETYTEVKALIDKANANQRLEDFTKAALSALDGYNLGLKLVAEDAVKIAQLTIEHLEQP